MRPVPSRARGVVSLALGIWATSACSAAPGRAASPADERGVVVSAEAEAAPERLPPVLEALELTAAQRAEVLSLRDELEQRLAPADDAGRELALAVATAARRCDADSLAVEDAASWMVVVGDQARGAVLDGIDRLHHLLTPAQRHRLAQRLLRNEEQRDDEERTDENARSLGDAIDLSIGQMIVLLARAQALRSAFEERLDPWRGEWKAAVRAFPNDDFAVRDHGIAQVPAVAMAMGLLRDTMRSLLPILERDQCHALGGFIEESVRERDARRSRRHPSAKATQ